MAGDWGPKGGGGGGSSGCTTSGSAILKGNGTGGCANAASGTDYQAPLGSNPSFGVNAPPTWVSFNNTANGLGTSASIPAPASITNGNVLVIWGAVSAANAETYTPPSGWTQLGSTLTATGNGKVSAAAFCKTASNESGSYSLSWNNGTGTGQRWFILNISGTNCANITVSGSATGSNTNSTTASSLTAASNNDMLLALGTVSQATTPTCGFYTPLDLIGGFDNTGTIAPTVDNAHSFEIAYRINGNGAPPNISLGCSAAQDNAVMVLDLAPTGTSSTPAVTQNGGFLGQGGYNSLGQAAAKQIGAELFVVPNVNTDARSGYWSMKNGGASAIPLMWESGVNMNLDPQEALGFVVIGSGGKTASDTLLLANGQVDWVSNDSAQDLIAMQPDSSNNLRFGNANSSGSSEENDTYFQLQTGKTFHWSFNNTDDATFNVNAFTLLGGTTLSVHGGTAPTLSAGCNGTGSSVAGTNTAGTITTQTAAATSCTLAFSASGTFANAPTCVFSDGNADAAPLAFSTGAEAAGSAVVDFPSASGIKINYVCIGG